MIAHLNYDEQSWKSIVKK